MPLYNPAGATVTDATISVTDVTTNNAATGQHGWLKKLDNSSTNFMNGQGNWAAPGISAAGLNHGTSNPGSPTTSDLFFRTDLGLIIVYDGTRWYCTCPHTIQPVPYVAGTDPGFTGDLTSSLTATTGSGGGRFATPSLLGGANVWLVDYTVTFTVIGGGTALDASNKWVGTLFGLDIDSASTGTVATTNINSGTSSSKFRASTVTIGAAMAAGTLWWISTWTKTGTPGNLRTGEVMSYRIIVT